MSRHLVARARAKLNLTLEVVGTRPDGYHELRSVMALIGLADEIRVGVARTLDVAVRPDVGAPPGRELTARAARALAAASGREARAHIRVRKRIPVAAGLGGGSADAGAALRALADLWRLEGADLTAVGAEIGSDVPFFASGAVVAVVGGRGERVAPLPAPAGPIHVVLVTLRERVATAAVFGALAADERSAGEATAALAAAFAEGRADPVTIRTLARNDLTSAAERVCPAIAGARASAADATGLPVHLTGSGATLFLVADDRPHALALVRRLRRAGLRAAADLICA